MKTRKPKVTVTRAAAPSRHWCVMKMHGWQNLSVQGIALVPPDEGPHYFIPVFNSREQAVAWAGVDEHIHELKAQ